jgi:hypothetical protein
MSCTNGNNCLIAFSLGSPNIFLTIPRMEGKPQWMAGEGRPRFTVVGKDSHSMNYTF